MTKLRISPVTPPAPRLPWLKRGAVVALGFDGRVTSIATVSAVRGAYAHLKGSVRFLLTTGERYGGGTGILRLATDADRQALADLHESDDLQGRLLNLKGLSLPRLRALCAVLDLPEDGERLGEVVRVCGGGK